MLVGIVEIQTFVDTLLFVTSRACFVWRLAVPDGFVHAFVS